jgi:hypothetical protein
MKERTLKNGEKVVELNIPVNLQIKTRCPGKYLLIDRETGQAYVGYDSEGKYFWKPVDPKDVGY